MADQKRRGFSPCDAVHNGGVVANGDLDGNGTVDDGDIDFLVTSILGTRFGDATLDGRVDSLDLNQIGIHWRQSDVGIGWATGDFTCDGMVDSQDLNQVGLNWQFGVPAAAKLPRAPLAAHVAVVAAHLVDVALADEQPRADGDIEKVLADAKAIDSNTDSSLQRVRNPRQSNHWRRLNTTDRALASTDLPQRATDDVTDEWFKRLGS